MDQGEMKGAMDVTSDGSVSKRCIREQAMDQGAIEVAILSFY